MVNAQFSETETIIKKKLKADLFIADSLNGDGVYKVRHRKTGKWGMCQTYSHKQIKLLIPMKYDDVLFFQPNAQFTAVFKNGKIGIYLSYWSYGKKAKQTTPCFYEDFKRISYNYQWYLALKKNSKWG